MRDHARSHSSVLPTPSSNSTPGGFAVLRSLFPYLWDFRGRVLLALLCLVIAKLANVGVPLILKQIVDTLDQTKAMLIVPVFLLIGYGLLRFSTTLFTELRDTVFAKVAQRAIRRVALEVFQHLHALSLRFHLDRQTGGMTRDIERGSRGIETLLRFAIFSILPTLLEMTLVGIIMVTKYDIWFAIITLGTLITYITSTIVITEWRTKFRRTMNEMDSRANTKAIDSLLNYETVKYFGNEEFEVKRYDENLQRWEQASVRSATSLSGLNITQSLLIASGLTLIMYRASSGVAQGTLTLGDLVLVNTLLIQLYIPLNFLGMIYREIKQALVDMDKMFTLLQVNAEIQDAPNAKELVVMSGAVRFEHVDFAYDQRRQILRDVDFQMAPGSKVAVVGSSGAGKSTLSRLLFRFYEVSGGGISIDGQDIRHVTQKSLRRAIGIVPQDTVLFNDTIYYNIAYGKPDAKREQIIQAAKHAHIHDFIETLPDKYDSMVGERGLKLSGGEKQRVAIARTILKNPSILVFDEATSALDSKTEKIIQGELREISRDRTTLVIAHRLSTIVDADQILVMDHGRIVERGTHRELLAQGGAYTRMWTLQQQQEARSESAAPVDAV
ncbi:MAG: ABC transporter ATP-binding protein/permease [Pseudomonadota bacterium]|nr:ABC transporter ATP-binding protein/permease [Pseudomonadota bacterium]